MGMAIQRGRDGWKRKESEQDFLDAQASPDLMIDPDGLTDGRTDRN